MSNLEAQLRDAIKSLARRNEVPPPLPSSPDSGALDSAPSPLATSPNTDFENAVRAELARIEAHIIEHESHVLTPLRIFARVNNIESMLVRIDDHITDLKTGRVGLSESLVMEMVSKLVLLQIAAKGARRD